jgi:ABC-type nitrate/sulfonate/bicarbonate transport system permease component
MQDERPIAPARPAVGLLQNLVQKLGEPRILGWIAVAFVLIGWEAVVAGARLNPIYLPRPSQILIALATMFRTGGLLGDLLATLARIFGGFAIALVAGTLLGIWMATSERVSAIADNFIAALYPLPKVTLIPLLIIWLGTGGPFMLAISALGAIFPIVINTVLGIRQCDPGPSQHVTLAPRTARLLAWFYCRRRFPRFSPVFGSVLASQSFWSLPLKWW